MAVIGEPLVSHVKRSASFAIPKASKKRINEFASYSSLRNVVTGLNKDLSRNVGYLSRYESKNFPDIVSVNLLDDHYDGPYQSRRSDTAKALRRNFCGKLHKDVCIKLKKETPSSTDTYSSLQNRHFMDAIDVEASCRGNHIDSEDEVYSSDMCKNASSLQKWSSMDVSSAVSDTSDRDVIAYQGRVVSRKYINSLPILFVPSVHSAMKFQFVKSLDSNVAAEMSVVQPLRKAFDQLFDVLHENLQTNDHDVSCFLTVVNRWTSVQTELSRHLIKSLMRKMRRSAELHSSFACYRVLMRALQTYPLTDGVPFSFADLEKTIDELSGFIEFSNSGCNNKLSVVNVALRLIFMVSCLENELLNCKLRSKRRVGLSCVCSWLSAEKKFTFVKRIIEVLVDFLKYQESFINDLVLAKEAQRSEDHCNKHVMLIVSELSPLLQRLIVMSQAVSTYPAQTADRIATELAAEYSQVALLSHRYEFLESLSVPLIKLKLCQRILERQYPSVVRTRVCGSLTSLTLDYLLNTYMRKGQNAGMKSEPGCQLDSDWVPCCVDGRPLPLERDICEEFSVLLFTIVLSYVQVKKEGKQNKIFSV